VAGKIKVTGSPLRIDGESARALTAPPVLGGDTREILNLAGLEDEHIDRLASEQAVLLGSPP